MKLELVQFPNTDNILLPGLLFSPDNIKTNRLLISLHGNGSSGGFYSVERQNVFGKGLTNEGIAYLTFTNTGGHLIQKFDQMVNGEKTRTQRGVAYELIKDCIQDINGAVEFGKSRGFRHIYLIGHSTGANKICVYHYYQPNNFIEKYILESGADDSGLYYEQVGKKKFEMIMDMCLAKIKQGKGKDLVPKSFEYLISYQSLYDLHPDGDYNTFPFYWQLNNIPIIKKAPWREIKSITKPTLIIYGDKDEYCYNRDKDCMNILQSVAAGKNNFQISVIPDADHSYSGKQDILVKRIVDFLR